MRHKVCSENLFDCYILGFAKTTFLLRGDLIVPLTPFSLSGPMFLNSALEKGRDPCYPNIVSSQSMQSW